tara:strand:- start:1308 stop:1415 length:108 start_codon:yes stop_codon:yes gene_type:complete
MTPEEYIEWIESLEVQVLTDELKETIIENFENMLI